MAPRQAGRAVARAFKELQKGSNASATRVSSSSARDAGVSATAVPKPSSAAAQAQQVRKIGLPAQEEAYEEPVIDFRKEPLPVHVDRVGAVSVVPEGEDGGQTRGLYQNRDGFRIEDGRYAAFTKVLFLVCLSLCPSSSYCSSLFTMTRSSFINSDCLVSRMMDKCFLFTMSENHLFHTRCIGSLDDGNASFHREQSRFSPMLCSTCLHGET